MRSAPPVAMGQPTGPQMMNPQGAPFRQMPPQGPGMMPYGGPGMVQPGGPNMMPGMAPALGPGGRPPMAGAPHYYDPYRQ